MKKTLPLLGAILIIGCNDNSGAGLIGPRFSSEDTQIQPDPPPQGQPLEKITVTADAVVKDDYPAVYYFIERANQGQPSTYTDYQNAGGSSTATACPRGGTAPGSYCALQRPDSAFLAGILDEARRLLRSPDTLCDSLGSAMQQNSMLIRTYLYTYVWRNPDTGAEDLTPGEYWPPIVGEGIPGEIHIALGYNPLNSVRPQTAINETARHEFAHLLGFKDDRTVSGLSADDVALRCAP